MKTISYHLSSLSDRKRSIHNILVNLFLNFDILATYSFCSFVEFYKKGCALSDKSSKHTMKNQRKDDRRHPARRRKKKKTGCY